MEIIVRSAAGEILGRASHPDEARLCLDHVWEAGDRVEILSFPGAHLRVRIGIAVPEGEIFCPFGTCSWQVPAGEQRLAYAPGAFDQPRNILIKQHMQAMISS